MIQIRPILAFVLGVQAISVIANTMPTVNEKSLWRFLDVSVNKHLDKRINDLFSFHVKSQYPPLDEFERREIDQVNEAFKSMEEVLTDIDEIESYKNPAHTQETVMTMIDAGIERIVKTLNGISYFRQISRQGQIHLLKKNIMNLLTLHSVKNLDLESGAWSTPSVGNKTQVTLDLFTSLKCPVQKERYLTFVKTIDPVLRKDQTAMKLISLISLFHSNNQEQIKGTKVQDLMTARFASVLYDHLLKRYVGVTYGDRGLEMLKTVPTTMIHLEKLNKTIYQIFAHGQIKDN